MNWPPLSRKSWCFATTFRSLSGLSESKQISIPFSVAAPRIGTRDPRHQHFTFIFVIVNDAFDQVIHLIKVDEFCSEVACAKNADALSVLPPAPQPRLDLRFHVLVVLSKI